MPHPRPHPNLGGVPSQPTTISDLLDQPLRTAADEPTTLRAQLGPRATVVVFLRHFG